MHMCGIKQVIPYAMVKEMLTMVKQDLMHQNLTTYMAHHPPFSHLPAPLKCLSNTNTLCKIYS